MKWSNYFLFTLKENPADAEIPSHQLMVRAGYIHKLAQGIYTYGPLALRVIKKVSKIIRDELDNNRCIEMTMPMVHPKELWEESGRWDKMGDLLLKFKNRTGQEWCLGGTHEEVITDYVKSYLKSYKTMPFTLYQIQTKYRDEIRPRFGLMRGREFIMKDAYSFDLSKEQAISSYESMKLCYQNIFSKMGLEYRMVAADSGDIGGDLSHEFHILADSGEDHLLVSDQSDYAANIEVCPVIIEEYGSNQQTTVAEKEELHTPEQKTISDLSLYLDIAEENLVKTLFYWGRFEKEKNDKVLTILLRGNDELNPMKLKKQLKLEILPTPLNAKDIEDYVGATPGSCGPVGVSENIYADQSINLKQGIIVGANKDNFHFKNALEGRDFQVDKILDLRFAKAGDLSPCGKGRLESIRGIEAGHIFYLGQKYSRSMSLQFLDHNGKSQYVEMGCYGIGVSRVVQACIEQNFDENGIVWPLALSPFVVHICHLDPKNSFVDEVAQKLYSQLTGLDIETFMDDRSERPGVKFKDADLLGFPLRLVIGEKGLRLGTVELVERKTNVKHNLNLESVVDFIESWIKNHKE